MKLFFKSTLLLAFVALTLVSCKADEGTPDQNRIIQFVYTSDAHYGIKRKVFQGGSSVDATVVNAALVAKINAMPEQTIPNDGGVNAGQKVAAIEFVANTGDFANRFESGCGSVTSSWSSFEAQYINGITLKKSDGTKSDVWYTVGNHDVSNAIGYTKTITVDPTSFINTYNNMLKPATPLTAATFDYTKHKVNFVREVGGIQFLFLNMWPDPMQCAWAEKQLNGKPAIIMTHDEAEVEAKHLISPKGRTDFGSKFENLIEITGVTTSTPTDAQQDELKKWLSAHPSVKAYFHGNTNFNQFYTFGSLPVFRVDSPMKGDEKDAQGNIASGADEKKLSFQLVSIDVQAKKMTVREVFWNPEATPSSTKIAWGASKTVSI